ncbi:MAG TPA: hypothetical protein VKH19_03445 [Gemmatimonadaceae bacterium]|nr:hypothetical protein [Gemmatimonadaceae bacterium]
MIHRREFIERSASLIFAAFMDRGATHRPRTVLRVGTLIDPRDHDLDAGLSFGADEANRSAVLFGWGLQRVTLAAVPRDDTMVHALVVGSLADTSALHVPVIAVRCGLAAHPFLLNACAPATNADAGERTVLWHESLERFGAQQLNDRYRAATRTPMTDDAWLGWFAMKMLAESAFRAKSVDSHALTAWLTNPTTQFDGHKGAPLRFDGGRRLRQPSYVLRRDDSTGRWSVDREIDGDAVVPRR